MKQTIKIADAQHLNALEAAQKHKEASKYMKFINDSVKDGSIQLNSVAERGIAAGILNNYAQICDSAEGVAFIKSGNYAPFIPEIWPIVVAWYPEFPLKDLISVQDMDKPLAWIYFSKLKVGRTKGNQLVGDVVETPLGERKIRGSYPTGEVIGEVIPKEQFEFDTDVLTTLTAYNPLVTNDSESIRGLHKIRLDLRKSNASVAVLVYDSISGSTISLKRASGSFTGTATVDSETGLITINQEGVLATTYDEIVINYVWDIEGATNANIPKVVEDVEQHPLEARPRALALEWTIFSEYVKRSQFGIDIRTDTTKRVLNLLYQYQVRYILDDMYFNSDNNGQTYTVVCPAAGVRDLKVVDREVAKMLKVPASRIEKESGRMEGNRLVVGEDFKAYFETLPEDMFKLAPVDKAWVGPRKIGTYRQYEVYYDPELPANEWWMTYRGSEWYDATYYLGEYMPVVPTDMTTFGTRVTTAFCAMEAYWFHKTNCVLKGTYSEQTE